MKPRGKGPSRRRGFRDVHITPSSGNVFADLGLPNPELLLTKSALVSRIRDVVRRRRLTDSRAAKVLGVAQPRFAALFTGQLSAFSLDRLFGFLNVLGDDVEIAVTPHRRKKKPSTIRVVMPRLTT